MTSMNMHQCEREQIKSSMIVWSLKRSFQCRHSVWMLHLMNLFVLWTHLGLSEAFHVTPKIPHFVSLSGTTIPMHRAHKKIWRINSDIGDLHRHDSITTGLLVSMNSALSATSSFDTTNGEESSTPLLTLERSSEQSKSPPMTGKDDAIAALQRLARRQSEELQETMTLLERLTAEIDDPEQQSTRNISSTSFDTLKATAASFLSGVDYGFVSRSEGAPPATILLRTGGDDNVTDVATIRRQSYGPPGNILRLGTQQFFRNLNAMKGEYTDDEKCILTPYQDELQNKLRQLTLNTTAIWEREKESGRVEAPWIIQAPYYFLCYMLDVIFEGKYVFSRFFLLETVARMPYFSYIAMLHLYETLGFWRRSADMKRIHFAEELNEYRHLLIQESLGGDQQWFVRFLSQHSAIVYFTVLCFLWGISPTLSYKFSEMLETHAVHTYGQFLDENEEALKELPPTKAAVDYYAFATCDPFYSEFQTSALSSGMGFRRPGSNMTSLYDVFRAIQADEADHVSTMKACLDPNSVLRSVSVEKQFLFGLAMATTAAVTMSAGGVLDTASEMTEFALGDASLNVIDATVASGVSLLAKVLSEGGNFEASTEQLFSEQLLRELDIIGALGIFLVGVRRFFSQVFRLIVTFVTTIFFPDKSEKEK